MPQISAAPTGHRPVTPMAEMAQRDDFELLREYAANGSQQAFAEVVRRYVDLVYSAAMRRVRDRHAAEDVTQVVFIVLAKKARRLRPGPVLSAWLLGVTRLAANDWLKAEARRGRREEAAGRERAHQMKRDTTSPTSHAAGGTDEACVGGVLDDAIAKLPAGAREALVLRFFEGKSFREVGERLAISEAAAKQRVLRSLERLRVMLGRFGAKASAESLAVTLAATAVLPAPQGLAATAAAVATSAAAAQYAGLVKGVTTLLAWAKAKTAAAAIAGAIFLAGGAATVVNRVTATREEAVAPPTAAVVEGGSAGSAAAPAGAYGKVFGVARLGGGTPVAGATVQLVPMRRTVNIYSQTSNLLTTTTDTQGRFELTPNVEPAAVIVRSDRVIGIATVKSPGTPVEVTVDPWGRMEGTVLARGKPVANADLFLWQPVDGSDVDKSRWVGRNASIRSDARGRFLLERVLPGDTRIDVREGGMIRRVFRYYVAPGETTVATVGETGRRLVGRVQPALPTATYRRGYLTRRSPPDAVAWTSRQTVATTRPATTRPSTQPMRPMADSIGNAVGEETTRPPSEPQAYGHAFPVAPDGTFSMDDVPPGHYQLSVRLGEAAPDGNMFFELSRGSSLISVPPAAGEPDPPPVNVGDVKLEVSNALAVGRPVPPLAGTDPDGKPLALAHFRGRFVLLHLSPGRAGDDAAVLKALHDRLVDARLVMVTAFVAPPEDEVLSTLAAAPGRPAWPQILPTGNAALTKDLAGSTTRLLLIDPDGVLLARAGVHRAALDTFTAALRGRLGSPPEAARVRVTVEHLPGGQVRANTPFSRVPPPRADDAAQKAAFSVVDGVLRAEGGAGGLERLHDGRIQPHQDSPQQSAFFDWRTLQGRMKIDLGRRVNVAAINTYSWHKNDRGPQVYTVYGSDGTAPGFDPAPRMGTDPSACGWTRIAAVDTRPTAPDATPGGRYGVSITGTSAAGLGRYQYLLFDMFVTETKDQWGHTFYGEIDVVEKK